MHISLRKIQNGYILSATQQSPEEAERYDAGYDRLGRKLKPVEVYCKDKSEVAEATAKLMEHNFGQQTKAKG